MTAKELILNGKHKVRRDSNLMHLYLQFFKEAYSYTPSCAGCSFGGDWEKFVLFYSDKTEKRLTLQKETKMITIKKIQGKILSYKKDGKTYRLYDNILNDAFISEYLKNGSKEEILERKKLFNFPVDYKQTLTFESELPKEQYEIVNNVAFEETDIKEFEVKSEVIQKKRGRKSKK